MLRGKKLHAQLLVLISILHMVDLTANTLSIDQTSKIPNVSSFVFAKNSLIRLNSNSKPNTTRSFANVMKHSTITQLREC
jgi:hypothetical protein